MAKRRVLVVDDETGVRESLRMLLKERYEVLTAASGNESLRRLDSELVDIVLLDILMPGMDGLEVLERIKEQNLPTQVVMLTATKTVKTAVTAMKLGAFDYVTKPFDIDELQLIVERAVESGRDRRRGAVRRRADHQQPRHGRTLSPPLALSRARS